MDARLEAQREQANDEKQLRLRSKTTSTAANQFGMSSSLDSGVGSFDESDASEKSCMKHDDRPEKSLDQEQSVGNPQGHQQQEETTFRFIYLGSAVLDKRYTQAMLPWVIAEVRRKKERISIVLNVEAMTVRAVDGSNKTLFEHDVQIITRCALSADKKCFSYLTKISGDVACCQCYVFEAVESSSVNGFLQGIRDAAKEAADQNATTAKENGSDSSLPKNNSSPNLQADASCDNMAVIFPLWYVGRVMVSHRQAPPTLIDDLVERFHKRLGMSDLEKQLKAQHSEAKEVPLVPEVNSEIQASERLLAKAKSFDSAQVPQEQKQDTGEKTTEVSENKMQCLQVNSNSGGRPRSASDGDRTKELYSAKAGCNSQNQLGAKPHSRNSSFINVGENRNVLFKISVQSLSCLSVATKAQLMERRLREVSFCQQGTKSPDHFGFICHDPRSGQYFCYVFKGQSEQLVDDVMQSLRQAFNSAWQAAGPTAVCDMCPLHHLHQLCVQLDGCTVRQQYDILQKHRINLTDEEMSEFTEMFKAESPSSGMSEENEVIMAILREIYERRQKQHTHIGQGNANQKNREGPNLLQKAKKSLSSSFGNFMSKRAKPRTIEEGSGLEKCEPGKSSPGLLRKRSATVDTAIHSSHTLPTTPLKESTHKDEEILTSTPHKDLKQIPPLQAGEGSPSYLNKRSSGSTSSPPVSPTKTPQGHHRRLSRHNSYGYRQAIFHSVVTPSKKDTVMADQDLGVVPQSASWAEMVGRRRSAAELRALWRKAIMEQILLIRMEKENTSLEVNVNEIETNLSKLSYKEVSPCSESAATTWKEILEKGDEPVDKKILLEAVKAGVPKAKRGEIWKFLVKQHEFHSPPQEDELWRQKSYEELKEVSSSHQHSIFIDLGRTFPSHPYFAAQLGRGQLCLFNVLKAYSVLDEEVGYCQGLSFVAGILLMHMKEAEAFDTLRFILYTLQVRMQYKPDMQKLQTQFYMLSRLLHDYYKPVYEFLLEYEITPTLYAAPWFLTLFASHFPVGFVARVLDMMFLQGVEVLFKVILLLLGSCQEELVSSDGLEGAVEVIKISVPPFAEQNVEWLVKEALSLDVSKDLESYEVEYCVLKEEDLSITSFEEIESERVESLEAELVIKTKQIQDLNEQLSCARNTIHGLESTISTMQINQTELLSYIRSLKAENDSLKRNFEKLKDKVLANGDVAEGVAEVDEEETITNSLTDCKPTCAEMNASFTEENTDSFEHIGSGDDLSDVEADSDEFRKGKPRTNGGTPPLSDKCEDLVVSR